MIVGYVQGELKMKSTTLTVLKAGINRALLIVIVGVCVVKPIHGASLHEMSAIISGGCDKCQWCSNCLGERGFIEYMIFPPNPNGYESLGWVNCSYCQGLGYVRCAKCQKLNLQYGPSKEKPKSLICRICRGRKTLPCGWCKKSGRFFANGMLVVCPTCVGRGWGTCPECKGLGKSSW